MEQDKQKRFGPKPLKQKQDEATIRTTARAERTPQQQLAKLDKKLGKGVGAERERAKLQKIISKKKKNDPTKCSSCGKPHKLTDADAGSAREIQRLCPDCYDYPKEEA